MNMRYINMAYINNQYLKLDISIKKIAKIEIKTDKYNDKLIEDLEIEDYPNVIIAYGEKVEYNNIFGGVKILITDETALIKNEYKIPDKAIKLVSQVLSFGRPPCGVLNI